MGRKILFDARWIGEHGIGRFAKEIREIDLDIRDIKFPWKPTNPFDTLLVSIYLMFNKGLFFSPGYNAPFLFQKRCIITVHDLNHIDIPYNTSRLKKIYYELVLKRACKNAHCILTVSEFSKKRILEWSKRDAKDIYVVGNGVSSEFFEIKNIPKENQILIVGNRKAHKNEAMALRAISESCIPNTVKVIFTGNETPELNSIIKKQGLSNRVIFKGLLSNEDLASEYRKSLFLLFPSLYEGFGLPVIESMACATPVIASNTTSLPEVSGEAALLVNPEDIQDIKRRIERLYNDKSLRLELSEKGLLNAQRYSWSKTRMIVKKIIDKYTKRI
ncbi:glycosyltransferase family 4 protein [Pluralibacter gergoviae]